MAVGERSAILQIHIRELRFINEISLYIGLYLLTAGIFLGAVWQMSLGDVIGDGIRKKLGLLLL